MIRTCSVESDLTILLVVNYHDLSWCLYNFLEADPSGSRFGTETSSKGLNHALLDLLLGYRFDCVFDGVYMIAGSGQDRGKAKEL